MLDILNKIHWLGHSSFIIEPDKTIILDPFKITTEKKADILFISHEHYDHCSPDDIEKVIQPSTIIVTVPGNQSKIAPFAEQVADVKIVKPGDSLEIDNIHILVTPAYNTNKDFHPKANDWVGFILTIDDTKIYYASDTDVIDEMQTIECDIAILPISGKFVMTPEEAAEATKILNPKVAIPMHYGDIIGTDEDAKKFESLCECDVKILDKN